MRKVLVWAGVIVAALVFGLGAAAGAAAVTYRSNSVSPSGLAGAQTQGNGPQGSPQATPIPTQAVLENPTQSAVINSGSPAPQATTFVAPGYGQQIWQGNWGNWNGYGMGPGMIGSSDWSGYNMGQGMMNGSGWNGYGMGHGMMDDYGWYDNGTGHGMMGSWNQSGANPSGQRITLDQALNLAVNYTSGYGSNLVVTEIMEFTNNFYVVVRESDSGRGAFELLVDPNSGAVYPEMGPNMMWNFKYGHMGGQAGDNTLTLEQARQLAQQALDANVPGAQVEPDGISFYGHYTFDFTVNGQIAGMLSVNGVTGEIWPHTWHGQFITEKEVTK